MRLEQFIKQKLEEQYLGKTILENWHLVKENQEPFIVAGVEIFKNGEYFSVILYGEKYPHDQGGEANIEHLYQRYKMLSMMQHLPEIIKQ